MRVSPGSNTLSTQSNRVSRVFIALLTLAVISAAVFWIAAATPYFRAHRESFGRYPEIFWDRRYGVWVHIFGGTLALFVGPVQLWLGQTRQKLRLHRALGKVYLLGIAIG